MAQALILALGGMLAAVLNQVSGDAFHAWIPWFTRRLPDLANRPLPEDQRERFAEEWASHINEVSGDVGKIAFAWGCVSAAHEMASLLNRATFTRFLDHCHDVLKRAMRPFNLAGSAIALFFEDIVLRERGVMRTIAMLTLVGGVLGFLTYLPIKKFFARYTSQSVVLIESQKVPENIVQPVVSDIGWSGHVNRCCLEACVPHGTLHQAPDPPTTIAEDNGHVATRFSDVSSEQEPSR